MKYLFLTIVFLLGCTSSTFSQVQKNIVKSYQYNNAHVITLAVEGEVVIEEWDENIVRLVTTIDALNFNEPTLKALTEAGRYTASSKNVDDAMILTMLKAQRDLEIRGILIEEKYTFKIFVPRGVTVEQVEHKDVAALF
jgi:branched-subunit amino acid aminotransferase/4-amino-4-deoxychorismate lyase